MFWSGMTGRMADDREGRAPARPKRCARIRGRAGARPSHVARQYRLTFRNVLRVRQGEEYAKWVARREGVTERDVRGRAGARPSLAGYDGIRIEYGGAVDYVAFSNRSIHPPRSENAEQRVANLRCQKVTSTCSKMEQVQTATAFGIIRSDHE